jgi:hypothetical protein
MLGVMLISCNGQCRVLQDAYIGANRKSRSAKQTKEMVKGSYFSYANYSPEDMQIR